MTTSTNRPPRSAAPLPVDFLDGLLGFHLRLAQLRAFSTFASALGADGLSPLLLGTLILIDANPGINQSELAGRLAADRSTMVRLIDQLEARAWVRRAVAPHDRRSTVPLLTDSGRALLRRAKPRVVQSERELLRPLAPAERTALHRLLRKLNADRR